MDRSLIIGFGNIDRADDGVAWHIVNSLRRRLGEKRLDEDNTGLEELGSHVDSVFLTQLAPELIDTLAGYCRVIFVDAHIDEGMDDLYCSSVPPESAPPVLSHHVTPAMLLALTCALHGRAPAGYLVSVRGYDFDFGRGLSARSRELVEPAACKILQLLEDSSRKGETLSTCTDKSG
ncbi:MAG: hydrogenase maturation protease [Syntrophales bacterium]